MIDRTIDREEPGLSADGKADRRLVLAKAGRECRSARDARHARC
ncbi:hypothetical protein ACVJGD_000052 [Bradyrhizobium sp. USDA 10063]